MFLVRFFLAGDGNARGLNGEDPVHLTSGEAAPEFLADLLEKGHVHLVVEETVHLEDLVVSPYFSLCADPLLQCFHANLLLHSDGTSLVPFYCLAPALARGKESQKNNGKIC